MAAPGAQTPSEEGGGLLARLTGGLFGRKPDQIDGAPGETQEGLKTPELDKTQAALEKLKEGVDATQALEELVDRIKLAFYTDLAEAGVPQMEYEQRWKKVEAKIRGYIEALRQGQVEASPEFQNLNGFIDNLDKVAALKDPDGFSKLAKTLADHPALAAVLPWVYDILINWADEGKEKSKDKKDSTVGAMVRRLAAVMAPEKAAEAALAAEAERKAAVQPPAPGQPETAPEAGGMPQEVFAFLDSETVRIARNNPQAKADFDTLKGKYTLDKIKEYAAAAAKPESLVNKIYGAARRFGGFEKNPARLFDIRFQVLTANVVEDKIVKPIADGQNLTGDKIRKFLDKIDVAKPDQIPPTVEEQTNV